jgi:RimJ/RimL family protein N-acetyltransferase
MRENEYACVVDTGKLVKLLKGRSINLTIVEKSDIPLLKEWYNDLELAGDYERIVQNTVNDIEKWYENTLAKDGQWFFIEKKDGTKIGHISQAKVEGRVQIGYVVISKERGKGAASDAVQVIVDYLFLSKDIARIQAEADPENQASIRVLEKAGFQREGVLRKAFSVRGVWRDVALYSILKEEWKRPRVLLKADAVQ